MSPSPDDAAPHDAPKPGADAPSQDHSLADRARHKLEHANEALEAAGLTVHGASFLLIWWKRLGLARAIGLLVMIALPAGGYSTLLYSASRSIPGWVGDFGVRFEAKESHIDLLHLRVGMRDVTVRADERSEPVFKAIEVDFQGSLGTLFRGLFGPGAFYNEITIRQGELRVERSLTGDYNLADFIERVPEKRRQAALAGLYQVRALYIEDSRIVYTEHVPGNSGGGVIQTAQATIFVDAVHGHVLDLVRPEMPGARPTRYEFDARSADGIVKVKGTAALFGEVGEAGGVRKASTAAESTSASGTFYQMNVYLENIGLGAYGRMVPTTRLVPTKGSLRGTVDLDRTERGLACKANMGAENLEFAPNPRLVVVKAQFDQLQKDLTGYRASGPFDPCGSGESDPRAPRETAGTMTAVLASFTAQTTGTAPPSVRAFAAVDQQQLAGVVADAAMTQAIDAMTGKVAGKVTQLAGQKAGAALQKGLAAVTPKSLTSSSGASKVAGTNGAATPSTNGGGNVVTKGVKGIGSGFKKLFGGGDKKDEKKDAEKKPAAKPPSE